ncbi:MAG: DUF2807 domain-containing protein [Caulobacteraceae bacterium]
MTRLLVIIAVVGAVLCTVCFGAAAALGGHALAAGYWPFGGPSFDWRGPETTREIAWSGGDALEIALPADVVYTQDPNAKLTVSGPKGAVDHVIMDGDQLTFEGRDRYSPMSGSHEFRLKVLVASPSTHSFALLGSPNLTIEGFNQDRLDIDIKGGGHAVARGQAQRLSVEVFGSGEADLAGLVAQDADVDMKGSGKASIATRTSADVSIYGSGDVTGIGQAKRVKVEIKGSGNANLGGVAADEAEVEIMGSGDVSVAPKTLADITIKGSGDVDLVGRPATLNSRIKGSGKIHQREAASVAAAS